MLPKNQHGLLTLVQLMKLFLFISKFKIQENNNIIINTKNDVIQIKKELQEKITPINNNKIIF